MEILDYKRNSLNTFRLLAALNVLWGHTLAHLELSDIPVLGSFIHFFHGVPIFFVLSGFLIWQSIGRSRSFTDYAKKRFWRIFPELWVAVAVEILVILLLYHQPINWPQMGIFAIGQATIFQFWTPDFLRGYGCGCPNGALWTITVLIQFYFLSYFVYKWLHNKRLYVWGGVMVIFLIIAWLTPWITKQLPIVLGKLYEVSIFPYFWMFLIASLAAEKKEKVLPFLRSYWWVFIVVLLLNRREFFHWDIKLAIYPFINSLLRVGGIIGFAYAVPQINIKTDISYGVYIYHMTIINALIVLGYVGYSWALWTVIGVTCFLAWISTKTIGRLSVMQKQKIR